MFGSTPFIRMQVAIGTWSSATRSRFSIRRQRQCGRLRHTAMSLSKSTIRRPYAYWGLWESRSIQCVAVVLRCGRKVSLYACGHVVANRNRRGFRTPIAPATPMKPGSATLPRPVFVPSYSQRSENDGAAEGQLCMVQSWPGQARTIWGDHKRFFDTYYAPFPGYYFTGDGARRDEDGYFWITGRVDDVLNVSGHRFNKSLRLFSPKPLRFQKRSRGFPHAIKGQGVYAYIILAEDKSTMQISSHNSNNASESRLCRGKSGSTKTTGLPRPVQAR